MTLSVRGAVQNSVDIQAESVAERWSDADRSDYFAVCPRGDVGNGCGVEVGEWIGLSGGRPQRGHEEGDEHRAPDSSHSRHRNADGPKSQANDAPILASERGGRTSHPTGEAYAMGDAFD